MNIYPNQKNIGMNQVKYIESKFPLKDRNKYLTYFDKVPSKYSSTNERFTLSLSFS